MPNSVFRKSIAAARLALSLALAPAAVSVCAAASFTQFEARQTHSIALTPDGSRLLALNSVASTLSVFDTTAAPLALVAEIPVGLEPVAVRARTDDEVWVVNEVGDSVSIVSLSGRAVVATLKADDEPADVVFAQGKAYVSCARNRLLRVFDASTRQELPPISLAGLDPRALAVNAAGTRVYAAFLLSGNGTTVLPRAVAPAQPAPENTALPDPPDTALIVPATDPRIQYHVLDRDVAEIEVATGAVTYHAGVGTNLLDLAVHPGTGRVWIANTEALNLVRFESALRGHIVDHRLSLLDPATASVSVHDLNLPAGQPVPAHEALAQPTALAFSADGSALWLAAFGSDRVAKVDPVTGSVLQRVDVRLSGGTSSVMRGPRALALHPTAERLYVLNKLSDSVSVISTATAELLAETPLSPADPMPAQLRAGRGFLFDARISESGIASCAVCHLDADRDGLAWDLGDPNGSMQIVMGANQSAHDPTPRERVLHPMKGPMVTQTLRGLDGGAPFHWRGDRPQIQSFNPAFGSLVGGAPIPSDDMDALAAYLLSLRHHPNPNRTARNSLPSTLLGGNPTRGAELFNLHNNHCAICHALPKGTDGNLDLMSEVGSSQPLKNPPLATVYQRNVFDPRAGVSTLSGFGLLHDGTGSILPTVHPYVLDELSSQADFDDVRAFVLCFESGTVPLVGASFTVTGASASSAINNIALLEQMLPSAGDLVVHGTVQGQPQRYLFSRSLQMYVSADPSAAPLTRAALLAQLGSEGVLTFTGVPPAQGGRFSSLSAADVQLAGDTFFVGKGAPTKLTAPLGVLANDPGVSARRDLAQTTVQPAGGAVVLNPDGSFNYTPGNGFKSTEVDTFQYRVLIAGDANNATSPARVTITTLAKAAGKYSGHVFAASQSQPAGVVSLNATRLGTFTGAAWLGATRVSFTGTIGKDGVLKLTRRGAVAMKLRLRASASSMRLSAELSRAGLVAAADLPVSSYSTSRVVPQPGAHPLVLTAGASIGSAPATAGTARLTLGKTGAATIAGKLGDGTAFSWGGSLADANSGGWQFAIYTAVYKFPAGSVSGRVTFDPLVSSEIGGTLRVFKPPQTRAGPYQGGFTLDYALTQKPSP